MLIVKTKKKSNSSIQKKTTPKHRLFCYISKHYLFSRDFRSWMSLSISIVLEELLVVDVVADPCDAALLSRLLRAVVLQEPLRIVGHLLRISVFSKIRSSNCSCTYGAVIIAGSFGVIASLFMYAT